MEIINSILTFSESNPAIAKYLTTGLRWVFVVLALYILVRSIMSLLSTRATPEVWGYFLVRDGARYPITHWENVIGRSASADIEIPLQTVSKNQSILNRRGRDKWMFKDLNSTNGTVINGIQLIPSKRYIISPGDEIVMGGVHATVVPISLEEENNNLMMRAQDKEPVSPWKLLLAVTVFQALTIVQLILGMGRDITAGPILAIILLCGIMWLYVTLFRSMGRKGFEMEMIAFFMTTIHLAVTTSTAPSQTMKELIATVIGILLMVLMCIIMRDLELTKKARPIAAWLSVGLFLINVLFGTVVNGASNWIKIGSFSFQPSEFVKLAFVLVGAGTLEELFQKRNNIIYAGYSFFCFACLALIGDFGTALIFFATYVVVSFLRSGDFSRLLLTVAGAGVMGLLVLRFKSHVAARFATWRHIWADPAGGGYQQTRMLSFGSGGGMLGLGAGNGSLKHIVASNTDLVFGCVMEEWGYVIAFLLVMCVITLSLFAVNSIVAGRSTFYTIGACGAATIFLVQTMLNVLGAVDILPFTGVTFPFVSTGGTSMASSWAMLAYFKAADMRKDASLAISRRKTRVAGDA